MRSETNNVGQMEYAAVRVWPCDHALINARLVGSGRLVTDNQIATRLLRAHRVHHVRVPVIRRKQIINNQVKDEY